MISRTIGSCHGQALASEGMGWDPWGEVDIPVLRGPLRHVRGAYVPDIPVIVLGTGLTSIEERCGLAHELAHHRLGHQPNQDPIDADRLEYRAQKWAAERLISITDLMEAVRWSGDIWELAEKLGVDPELLQFRLDRLDDNERRELGL